MPEDQEPSLATSDGDEAGPRDPDVYVSTAIVRGFRCLRETRIDLEPTTTFLIGENNAGKTSLLMALAAAVGAYRPVLEDLHRLPDGRTVEEATIDVRLRPREAPRFSPTARRLAAGNVHQVSGVEVAAFRTTLAASQEGARLTVDRTFLQPEGAEWIPSPTPFRPESLRLLDAHVLDASRDLSREATSQTSGWGRVLSDLQIPAGSGEETDETGRFTRRALEAALRAVADDVRAASPVLLRLQEDLQRMRTQAGVAQVDLVPLPPSIDDLARTIDVLVQEHGSVGLPLRFHGLGSRSLATMVVFHTLCSLRLGADRGVPPHLLTLLEEPETHLHPQAVIALAGLIEGLPGQRIVSTHSPQLIAEVDLRQVRVLRREGSLVSSLALSDESLKTISQFRRFVVRSFGDLLYSRLVVLGDGSTERNALPVLLGAALGTPPAALGIGFTECENLGDPSVPRLTRVLSELGIPWIVFADNDHSGRADIAKLSAPDGSPLSFTSPNVVVSGTKQMEQLLIDAGYGGEVIAVAAAAGHTLASDAEKLIFLKKNKPWAAEEVARAAMAAGRATAGPVAELASRISQQLGVVLASSSTSTPTTGS